MTPRPRSRVRTQAATALTTVLLTGAITVGLHHHPATCCASWPSSRPCWALSPPRSPLPRPSPPIATTRTTLDLLLRLVPWYTPKG
ncbi:hypothetical protein ACWELO_35170 [Streptomyces sp. NPDC004596]